MSSPVLLDLVQNGTMSPSIATTLALAAEERRSMLFVAIPRLAGKTTTLSAALSHVPAGTPIHRLKRSAGPTLGIPETADGGYLLMSEIAETGFDDYLWGAETRQVFAAAQARGFSIATALHAGGIEEAFTIIAAANEVPDEHAAVIDLVVYIRSLGSDWRAPTRRVIAEVHEVEGVANGHPDSRLLHRWSEPEDEFQDVESPKSFGLNKDARDRHLKAFSP